MSIVKIKHRDFEIIEEVNENTFIANFKNKQYVLTKFEPKTHEADLLTYSFKRIDSSPIRSPRLLFTDKKAGYVVREKIDVENMADYLAEKDLPENLLDQLFKNAYFARMAVMTIDYSPLSWGVKDDELFYMGDNFIPYCKEKDLIDKYIRLWFNTRELAEFLKNNGRFYDKTRIKDEYLVNKEIVLMACKYYR